MAMLTQDDLSQMDRPYFEKLNRENLVDVAYNLRNCAVTLAERLEQNSENSSKPPSSDNPFKKKHKKKKASEKEDEDISSEGAEDADSVSADEPSDNSVPDNPKRLPGKQPGAQGFWRSETPIPEDTIPHYPGKCAACGIDLTHFNDFLLRY